MIKDNNNSPLVSVIVPVFNVEKYVGQCLKSIHNQSYQNLEIIVVDDGSTDNSLKVCQNWAQRDSRIRIVEEKNSGLSTARNNGLASSVGKYVLFVDSDDWLASESVERMVNAFCEYDADMVTCQFFYYDGTPHLSFNSARQAVVLDKEEYIKKLLNDQEVTAHIWRKMFKRELMPQRPFWEGHIFEDIAAMPGLIDNCQRFVLLAAPLYYYRVRPSSIVRTSPKVNITEHYKSLQKALGLYRKMDLGLDNEIISYGFMSYWVLFCGIEDNNIKNKGMTNRLIKKMRECPIKPLRPRDKVLCFALKIMPANAYILYRIKRLFRRN